MTENDTARGDAPETVPRAPVRSRRGESVNVAPVVVAVCFLSVLMVIFALPAFVIFIAGMLPTVGAFLTDRSPARKVTQCIAATNFSGVLPIMVMAMVDDRGVASAITLLQDVFKWLLMIGAAAAGWAVLWIARTVAEVVVNLLVAQELKRLQDAQGKILATWGRKVLDE
ncbi:MAG: hypothetical protein QF827_10500 [Alphaproteobacteria bacterium]|jgi:hypothetical protein|nr:hypothetical protein [Alphaproteobacteria bacterium]